jgi:hypothetical protein
MARGVDLVVIEGSLIRERSVADRTHDRCSGIEGRHSVVGLSANHELLM